ncbi:hypothetical protein F183_A02040 [Bryobacterales bacterium F-183]|nr:hypothetical protein F183_A02040 [Bryobacterales bacterium F-183]
MQLSEIFVRLGEATFTEQLKGISMGKLKTYKLYERLKTRCHLQKLNTETLRKAAPRLLDRISGGEEDLATEIAQCVLICHMDMIMAVLDFLQIPHEDGFFAKDADIASYLKEGWQQRVYDEFQDKFSKGVLLLYINHLDWEMAKAETVFQPAAAAA